MNGSFWCDIFDYQNVITFCNYLSWYLFGDDFTKDAGWIVHEILLKYFLLFLLLILIAGLPRLRLAMTIRVNYNVQV